MSNQTLLIVDDDPRIRTFVSEVFAGEGLRLLEATTGLDALELTEDLIPDLILLDIHMPRLDGLKALAQLRKRPALDGTPIVMFTVEREAAVVTQTIALGADDFIAKPFVLATLEEKVWHWLKNGRTRRDRSLA